MNNFFCLVIVADDCRGVVCEFVSTTGRRV